MKRTQIYLPEKIHQELSLKAQREKVTISEVTRQILEAGLPKTFRKKANSAVHLLNLAKEAEKRDWSGPVDLSTKVDDYLYQE